MLTLLSHILKHENLQYKSSRLSATIPKIRIRANVSYFLFPIFKQQGKKKKSTSLSIFIIFLIRCKRKEDEKKIKFQKSPGGHLVLCEHLQIK